MAARYVRQLGQMRNGQYTAMIGQRESHVMENGVAKDELCPLGTRFFLNASRRKYGSPLHVMGSSLDLGLRSSCEAC